MYMLAHLRPFAEVLLAVMAFLKTTHRTPHCGATTPYSHGSSSSCPNSNLQRMQHTRMGASSQAWSPPNMP